MKRQQFYINNMPVWGVPLRDGAVLLNVAGKNITPAQVKAIGKVSTGQETLKVNDALDPWAGRKHKNVGKFIEVYTGNSAPTSGSRDQGTSRRTTELG